VETYLRTSTKLFANGGDLSHEKSIQCGKHAYRAGVDVDPGSGDLSPE
jgi:hypothetical protein